MGRRRQEHVLELVGGEELEAGFGKTHRRHLRRGVRAGWTFRALGGPEAVEALERVQGSTGARAEALGRGFSPNVPRDAATRSPGSLADDRGIVTFGAWNGDVLLAAALIGYANGRGFYVAGGSTPQGFKASASVWLQWQIMCSLLEHGYTAYNMGGTPASAGRADDPAHGLFRFKTGFGAAPVPRVGAQWICNAWHEGLHTMIRRVARRIR